MSVANLLVYLFNLARSGNSAKATSGINAMTEPGDSMEAFEQDTLKSGGGLSDPVLVHKLVHESRQALDWLLSRDDTLNLSVVSRCGGHSHPRTHRCPPRPDGAPVPVGWRLIQALKQNLQTIEQLTSTSVTGLAMDEKGVKLTVSGDRKILATSVVLTSGGFGGQVTGLLKEYAPELVNMATTNGPWANGDGVRLAISAGAATRDMEQVQIHPTGFVDPQHPDSPTKFLAPEALRAHGGVLLDSNGKRFANELDRRDALTSAISKHCPTAHLVLTDAMVESFGRSTLQFYAKKGLFTRYENLEMLAEAIGANRKLLLEEFERYDKQQQSDFFGKTYFPAPLLPDTVYWKALVTPCVHYTMGGVEINQEAEVLNKNKQPIPGKKLVGKLC